MLAIANISDTFALANQLRSAEPQDLVNGGLIGEYFSTTSPDSVPVLICARNEAQDLPACLTSLALSEYPVSPVVADSGSDDETATIAEKMGATVLYEEKPGKIPAFQTGLAYIRDAFNAQIVLSTDADTIVGPQWSRSMEAGAANLHKRRGGIACGLVGVTGGESRATDLTRTVLLNAVQVKRSLTGNGVGARGPCLAINFGSGSAVFQALMEESLPLQFPGTDRAQVDAIVAAGGQLAALRSPSTLVITRGDRYKSLPRYLAVVAGLLSREAAYKA